MNAPNHNSNPISDWLLRGLDAVLQGLLELAVELVSGLLGAISGP
jgi:hypothetical protein